MSRITAPLGEVTIPITSGRKETLLARDVEQTLRGQLLLALLEQSHERADAGRCETVDDQLVLGAARKGGDAAGRHDLEAVLGSERQAQRRAAPAHGIQAGGVVLEREVAVAGAMLLKPEISPRTRT